MTTIPINIDLRGPGMKGYFETLVVKAIRDAEPAAVAQLQKMMSGKADYKVNVDFETGTGAPEVAHVFKKAEENLNKMGTAMKKASQQGTKSLTTLRQQVNH